MKRRPWLDGSHKILERSYYNDSKLEASAAPLCKCLPRGIFALFQLTSGPEHPLF